MKMALIPDLRRIHLDMGCYVHRLVLFLGGFLIQFLGYGDRSSEHEDLLHRSNCFAGKSFRWWWILYIQSRSNAFAVRSRKAFAAVGCLDLYGWIVQEMKKLEKTKKKKMAKKKEKMAKTSNILNHLHRIHLRSSNMLNPPLRINMLNPACNDLEFFFSRIYK